MTKMLIQKDYDSWLNLTDYGFCDGYENWLY